jgi:siroheme synthase-like protein
MSLLPIFLKLRGRRVLVVGGGNVAESKIESLLLSEAEVHVVAPELNANVAELAGTGTIAWRQKSFDPSDLDGVFLVIAATTFPKSITSSIASPKSARFCVTRSTIPSIATFITEP